MKTSIIGDNHEGSKKRKQDKWFFHLLILSTEKLKNKQIKHQLYKVLQATSKFQVTTNLVKIFFIEIMKFIKIITFKGEH